ncbi:hypothetical protein MMC10_003844 [Thelotrema lepadinum]|nr:hypothetical protein [Thelotrema lepadinum]
MIAASSVRHSAVIASALVSFLFVGIFITIRRSNKQDVGHAILRHSGCVSINFIQQSSETSVSATATSSTATYWPPTQSRISLALPSEYEEPVLSIPQWCANRFEIPYLTNMSKTQTEYCNPVTSTGSFRCFNTPLGRKERTDSFCMSALSLFNPKEKQFQIDCDLRHKDQEEVEKPIIPIQQFPYYWYQTGPRILMERYLKFTPSIEHVPELAKEPRKFVILVRREEAVFNIWHQMMELMALTWTLDVLRISLDLVTGLPLFTLDDIENTRIVIEDNWADGPYLSLWTMFAKRPIIRLSEISAEDSRDPETIIFPFPGETNPMWQVDWKAQSCDHSTLLNVFLKRVLHFYTIKRNIKQDDSPLILTFIDRREKRRLTDKEDYVEELKKMYPVVQIQTIDFAAIPFMEQLKIVVNTDILVGVHGAGLTHTLFLPPGSAVVEIQPPDVSPKGYRSLAHLLGHHYFSGHALGSQGDWAFEDVFLEKDRFMRLVGIAIASMYNRGSRNDDVI